MAERDCIIITIDGPAGSGKSTLAQGLASTLEIAWFSSGATYRALAYKAFLDGVDPSDPVKAAILANSVKIDFILKCEGNYQAQVFLDDADITDKISGGEISTIASRISRHAGVREALVRLQREIASRMCRSLIKPGTPGFRGVVVEGRDMGTVVFPDAELKIYLDASLEERAQRRMSESATINSDIGKVAEDISRRDHSDSTREVSSLKPATDAVLIDNTGWAKEQTLEHAIGIIRDILQIQ